MSGPQLIEPAFPDDDGSADPRLAAALAAYAEGGQGEYAVLRLLAHTRLLVPVVALRDDADAGQEVDPDAGRETGRHAGREAGRESGKGTEMALPTLVGADGRRAVLAFTSADAMARWQPDARPVPVRARQACQAAVDDGADAVMVDVAGPVPLAVAGHRLRALAGGEPVPAAYQDLDVLAAVEVACAGEPGISAVRVGPGRNAELSVHCTVPAGFDERDIVSRVADRLTEQLRGRVVGGVELGVVRG